MKQKVIRLFFSIFFDIPHNIAPGFDFLNSTCDVFFAQRTSGTILYVFHQPAETDFDPPPKQTLPPPPPPLRPTLPPPPLRQTLTGPLTDLDQSLALTERALFHHHDIRLDKCEGESRLLAEGHVPRAMPAATMDRQHLL